MSSNIRVNRICKFCGKNFIARTTVTNCCGDWCAKRLYKRKVKEAKVDQANTQTTIQTAMATEDWKVREYLSVEEFRKLVGVSRWTLWRAIKRGEIKAGKIGRRVIIKKNEIENFYIK